MNKNEQVGKRLSEEIEEKYGSLRGAAQAIGAASGSYFRPYIAGDSRPGMTLRKKLANAGIDVNYVMTGKKTSVPIDKSDEQDAVKKSVEDMQARLALLNTDLANLAALVNKK